MGEYERSGDGEKRGEEVDAGALFVLKSKGTYYMLCKLIYIVRYLISRMRCYQN